MKKRNRSIRRGGTSAGVLAVCVVAGAMLASAALVGPRVLRAAGSDEGEAAALQQLQPDRRAVIETLGQMLESCHQVLAVHHRGPQRPFTEILLWLEDGQRPGRIDEGEVGLLSHSRVLQTLVLTVHVAGDEADGRTPRPADWAPGDTALRQSTFCDWWRGRRGAVPRLVARDISDLSVAPAEAAMPGRSRLQLSLTWSGEAADARDSALVLVDVRGGRSGAVE